MSTFNIKKLSQSALLTVMVCSLLYSSNSFASDKRERTQLKEAIAAGKIIPMQQAIERAERHIPGKTIKAEVDRESQRWVYEIKVIDKQGIVKKIKLDARTGELFTR